MMKRQWKLVLCLLVAALTLSSCASENTSQTPMFAEVTQALGPATQAPTDASMQSDGSDASGGSIFSNNPYDVLPGDGDMAGMDPLSEEDIDPNAGDEGVSYVAAEGTIYPYAGSTPIPLAPVDAPSPTPRPAIAFTFIPYTANLGITFEAPTGWMMDESQPEVLTLTEPVEQMNDNQQCIVTISAIPVTSNYSESNLRSEVNQRLDTISSTNFSEWRPSLTATRYMMGSLGVYANYTGTLANGTDLGGRVHYVCVDRVLYGVEIMYPLSFREDYLNVFSQIRETIKRTSSSTV